MSVILLFIDGLGIGERNEHNPLARLDAAAPLAVFDDEEPTIFSGGRLIRTDACLGVEGRPQSASGQTTILTGTNAAAALGYHKQGFPNERLREILRERSIFLQLKNRGVGPNAFANAYSPRFFNQRPRWVSATTVAVEAAKLEFRTLEDVRADRALYHDFTNEVLIEAGMIDAPRRTPEAAARVLASIAATHQFTLYEYFLTDRAGHEQNFDAARRVLTALAKFVRALIGAVDQRRTTVILTSDHGNIEDLSKRNHTRNPVPTLVWGAGRDRAAVGRIRTLADITPTIISLLEEVREI